MPSPCPPRSSARRRSSRLLTALSVAGLLAACAQLPESGPAPRVKAPEAFQATATLSAVRGGAWPAERWWQAYGDPQLDALIDEALAGAPDLAAAQARVAGAAAMTQRADAVRQPQLSLNASATEEKLSYNYLYPQSMLPQGMNDYGRATLDLRWELDFWGQHRAGLAAATSEQEAAGAELAQARLALTAGLAAAYAELSRLYANRDTALQAVALRRQTAALLDERLKNGLETRGGLREADARRATAEGQLLALDEQIALQRNRLAALLGAGPDRGLKIERPALKLDRGFGLPPQLAADLLGRRPDIVAARRLVQAQDHRIEQKKAEFYPNVNLSAFVGVQALGLNLLHDSGSQVAGIGPAISLPLFTGGRLQGELRGAQARHAEAVALYDATVAHALQDVADQAVSLRALAQRLDKAGEAVEAATEAHRVALERYRGGLGTRLEALAAEDGLLQTLNTQTNLRALSVTLDIALQRALGGGYRTADAASTARLAQR